MFVLGIDSILPSVLQIYVRLVLEESMLLQADSLWSMNNSSFTTVSLSSTGDNSGGVHTHHHHHSPSVQWVQVDLQAVYALRVTSVHQWFIKNHQHWMHPEFMKNRWGKFFVELFHETPTIHYIHSYAFVFPWSRNNKHGRGHSKHSFRFQQHWFTDCNQ